MASTTLRRIRILQLLKRPEDGVITATQIRDKLWDLWSIEASQRTVQRDLRDLWDELPNSICTEAIEDIDENGADIVRYRPNQGWWWCGNDQIKIPSIGTHSALALWLVKNFMKNLLPSETLSYLRHDFDQAEKIMNSKGASNHFSRWKDKVAIERHQLHRQPPAIKNNIKMTITKALYEERMLKVSYKTIYKSYDAGDDVPKIDVQIHKNRRIVPFGLIFSELYIQLVCYVTGRNPIYGEGLPWEMGDYKVDDYGTSTIPLHNILNASVLDEKVTLPKDIDIQNEADAGLTLNQPWIGEYDEKIKLWVTTDMADSLQDAPLSGDQIIRSYNMKDKHEKKLSETVGYGLIVEATVEMSQQVITWILSYPDEVILISPISTAEYMKIRFSRVNDVYRAIL